MTHHHDDHDDHGGDGGDLAAVLMRLGRIEARLDEIAAAVGARPAAAAPELRAG